LSLDRTTDIIESFMRRSLAIGIALIALFATTSDAAPAQLGDRSFLPAPDVEPSGPQGRFVIGAAGDIACPSDPNGPSSPQACQYDDTADLIFRTGLDEILPLGDNQYDIGAFAAFMAYFDPTWGRALANMSPVPGNHEHAQDPASRPSGYFRYFGDRVKGPQRLGYYSYDLGACPDAPCWHLVALDSMLCFAPGGCGPAPAPTDPGPGNRMYRWLERDLERHPDATYPCTLAYWHHPRFSFSTGSGGTAAVGPLWDLLYAAGADVVLNGHSHNYQRWRRQDPDGNPDTERGIREFVVGTGGASLYAIPGGDPPPNLVVAQDDSFGILRIALKAERYRWAWVTAAGQPQFADAPSHGAACVRATN
jgi:acid phosphatase type 7